MSVSFFWGHPVVEPSTHLSKGFNSKNAYFENFVFVISQLNIHPIFKILVSTPHNYPLIMGGGHKNFEDWMNIELLNYENKIFKICVFAVTPFTFCFFNPKLHLLSVSFCFSIQCKYVLSIVNGTLTTNLKYHLIQLTK